MNEWHFIPITVQYLVAGILSLMIGFYAFRNSRGSSAAKFFVLFTIFLFLWQFLMFLHRNAPDNSLSKVFFIIGSISTIFALLTLFLSILSLQTINIKKAKYYVILVLVLLSLALIIIFIIYAPLEIIWTDYGWSYLFGHGIFSFALPPLTFLYVILNYTWIRKIIKEGRHVVLKTKYKFILFGFTMIFIVNIFYNAFPLSLLPNAPPIGGASASIGLLMIAHSILLKEKPQRIAWLDETDLSTNASLFLQEILNSIHEDALGQQYILFEKYLKEMELDKVVSYTEGKIVVSKGIESSHIVKMLDKTLEYIEKGNLTDKVIPALVSFWNKVYPIVETDSIALIKTYEKVIIKNRLLHEIAEGKLRSIFLSRSFSEENLDGFSRYLGFTHKDLFGNPILVEVDPAESYEDAVKFYVYEVLANREELAVFTRKGSRILKYLSSEQVYIFYLSSEASEKVSLSSYEVELPLYDLTYLLGEISSAAKKMHSLLIDNITDLIYSIGFKKTYRLVRSAIEAAVSYNTPALFIIIKAHSDKVMSAFENIFPIIAEIKGNAVMRKKP